LLQILLNVALEWFISFLTEQPKNLFFSAEIFCLFVLYVLKLAETNSLLACLFRNYDWIDINFLLL